MSSATISQLPASQAGFPPNISNIGANGTTDDPRVRWRIFASGPNRDRWAREQRRYSKWMKLQTLGFVTRGVCLVQGRSTNSIGNHLALWAEPNGMPICKQFERGESRQVLAELVEFIATLRAVMQKIALRCRAALPPGHPLFASRRLHCAALFARRSG